MVRTSLFAITLLWASLAAGHDCAVSASAPCQQSIISNHAASGDAVADRQRNIVFRNGAPNFTNGFEDGLRVLADDFMLGVPTTLTSLRFWAIEQSQSSYNGSISWWIYTDNSGIPGSQVPGFAGASAPKGTYLGTGSNPLAPYRYVYTFELATPGVLPAGHYWLVLHNGPVTQNNFTGFSWAMTAPNTTYISQQSTIVDGQFGSISGWGANGVQLAFELAGLQ